MMKLESNKNSSVSLKCYLARLLMVIIYFLYVSGMFFPSIIVTKGLLLAQITCPHH